jgi:hypothetical protein
MTYFPEKILPEVLNGFSPDNTHNYMRKITKSISQKVCRNNNKTNENK